MSYACHAVWNCDTSQASALIERRIADAGDTIGNRDALKTTATIERLFTDGRDTVRDRDVC